MQSVGPKHVFPGMEIGKFVKIKHFDNISLGTAFHNDSNVQSMAIHEAHVQGRTMVVFTEDQQGP